MALTTRAKVLGTAPELAAVPDPAEPEPSQWRQLLEDVDLEMPATSLGDKAELAQRLWVAHTLTLMHPELRKREVTSVTIGGMSKSYSASATMTGKDWGLTPYGQRLEVLLAAPLLAVGVT